MQDYNGKEPALALSLEKNFESDTVFDVRAPNIPLDAVPVFDDELSAVVGYRHESVSGVYRDYDLEGKVVGMEEKGLETPLFDPIDLIFFASGVARAIVKGIVTGVARTAPKIAAVTAAKISVKGILSATVLGAMRAAFKRLTVRSLKFTATTAARMAAKGRYVPINIYISR